MSEDGRIPLSALQREATWVNELQGVQAFLYGVLHEILKCKTIVDAKTCAEMGLQGIAGYGGGMGVPRDDPADWRSR